MSESGKADHGAGITRQSVHLNSEITFSQRSLQDYLDCQRRFELRYLDKLRWPAVTTEPIDEFEALTELGNRFHQMVHRERSGVAPDLILENTQDKTLLNWFQHYLSHFPRPDREYSYSEVTLVGSWNKSWRMTATCDLIYYAPDRGFRIIDWKTTRRKTKRSTLRKRVQTSLYPLLFSEVGQELFPGKQLFLEGIQLVYWYPEFPTQPELFNYTREQAQEDRMRLEKVVEEISDKITDLKVFPKTEQEQRCRFCVYRSFCGRGVKAGILEEEVVDYLYQSDLDLDSLDINEINSLRY